MTRIVDVARRAGVSTATVSRVLNGKSVRPALAAAVHDAVAELGYTPDRTARSLRRRHSETVALVLPDVENPFFTAVARGVEDAALAAGYSVVLCNTDDRADKEDLYLTVADVENMAGVVLAPADAHPAIDRLVERGRSVVVIDRRVAHDVDQVTFDNRALGHRAATALLDRGFRRIACVTGPATTSTAVDRAEGWRAALHDAGLAADDDLLVHANFRVDGGYDAIGTLLGRSPAPDAVVATNNLAGVGVLRALADRHGGPVPAPAGDGPDGPGLGVGVIGDLPFATSRTSDVALVPLNPRGLGTTAARLLLERIAGSDAPARHLVQEIGDGTDAVAPARPA
ncbi:LacI family DNA-binding transcriptional regulator [Isoptericola sp. BMS4]|uniref:LacI family DNA-binding transcriptional regulator n=1 Tax=Isoptericola sp. BMS4 TaxID=2527875 RepID=UPI0014226F3A|nr:LacI family DNA-binding transcriptional regulator [Isoptericola sp. BMS4]